MTDSKNHSKDHRYDTRVMKYALRRKELTHQDIADQLASLPDEADEAVEVSVKFATPYADRMGSRQAEGASSES